MSETRVKSAGVGFPSGDIGIPGIQTHFPYSIYSESAGAVNFRNSLSAPAIVIPGISQDQLKEYLLINF